MRSFITLLSVILVFNLQAQQVFKCCNNTNSSFLLGNMNYARHNQGIYLPSDFQNAMAGNITRLYFRYGSSNVANGNIITNLQIGLLQSGQTAHVNDQFITGVTPVFQTAVFHISPGVADHWFHIQLDQPFPYDPSLSLIVDIRFEESERTMTCRSVATPGRKLATGDLLSPVGTTSSTNLHDIGFDLDGPTSVAEYGPMISMLHPNPATDVVHVTFAAPAAGISSAEVLDVSGRTLIQQPFESNTEMINVNVSPLVPGAYIMRIRGKDDAFEILPFIRE